MRVRGRAGGADIVPARARARTAVDQVREVRPLAEPGRARGLVCRVACAAGGVEVGAAAEDVVLALVADDEIAAATALDVVAAVDAGDVSLILALRAEVVGRGTQREIVRGSVARCADARAGTRDWRTVAVGRARRGVVDPAVALDGVVAELAEDDIVGRA